MNNRDRVHPRAGTKEPVHIRRNVEALDDPTKIDEHLPGGVIKLTGEFVLTHKEEILNLIRHQTRKSDGANPTERVMSIEAQPDGMELTTTNDKLAQRIGKALHKAYSGEVEYKRSPEDGLARVNWRRETQKGGHGK